MQTCRCRGQSCAASRPPTSSPRVPSPPPLPPLPRWPPPRPRPSSPLPRPSLPNAVAASAAPARAEAGLPGGTVRRSPSRRCGNECDDSAELLSQVAWEDGVCWGWRSSCADVSDSTLSKHSPHKCGNPCAGGGDDRVAMRGWKASSGTEAAVSRAQPTNSHAGASWELPSKIVEAQPTALHDHLPTLDDSAHCLAVGRCRCDARPCECLPLRATDARLPRCTPCTARRPFMYPGAVSVTPAAPLRGVKKEPFKRILWHL